MRTVLSTAIIKHPFHTQYIYLHREYLDRLKDFYYLYLYWWHRFLIIHLNFWRPMILIKRKTRPHKSIALFVIKHTAHNWIDMKWTDMESNVQVLKVSYCLECSLLHTHHTTYTRLRDGVIYRMLSVSKWLVFWYGLLMNKHSSRMRLRDLWKYAVICSNQNCRRTFRSNHGCENNRP